MSIFPLHIFLFGMAFATEPIKVLRSETLGGDVIVMHNPSCNVPTPLHFHDSSGL